MMISWLTLLVLPGLCASLTIPPPAAVLTPRGASLPTVENYTATYLRNRAIQEPPQCRSYIGIDSYPDIGEINATKCAQGCAWINTMYARGGYNQKCRFFNMYLLFVDDVNMGLQCTLYDRRWDNSYATNNGTIDPWGRPRKELDEGRRYEVADSFAYYLTDDPGVGGCGRENSTTTTGAAAATQTVAVTKAMDSVGVSTSSSSSSSASWLIGTSGIPLIRLSSTTKAPAVTATTLTKKTSTKKTSTKKTSSAKPTAKPTTTSKKPKRSSLISTRDEQPHWGSTGGMPSMGH